MVLLSLQIFIILYTLHINKKSTINQINYPDVTPLSNGPIAAHNLLLIAPYSAVVYGTSIIVGQYSLAQLYSENGPSIGEHVSLGHNAHDSTQVYDYIHHACSHISTRKPLSIENPESN